MNSQTEIKIELHLDYRDSEEATEPLIKFFEPVTAKITTHRPELAIKAIDPMVIIIAVGIFVADKVVGAAIERATTHLILDPLTKRTKEWWQGINSLWNTSAKRPLHIVIRFENPIGIRTIEINQTSDSETLKQAWHHMQQAYETYTSAQAQGIQLGQIRILPDSTNSMLAIGYEGKRPKYIINLRERTLQRIKEQETTGIDPLEEIGKLKYSAQRLDYLERCAASGFQVSTDEVSTLKHTIERTKQNLAT